MRQLPFTNSLSFLFKIKILAIGLLFSQISFAQNLTDSLAFKKVKWEKKELAKGVFWQHFHFNQKQIFGSNQNINLIIFDTKKAKLEIGFADAEGDSLLKTSTLGQRNNALAAINGSFFDMKKGGAVDLIRVKGKTLDTTQINKNRLAEHQQSALIIDNNSLKIVHSKDSSDIGWDNKLAFSDIMTTGPLLIFNQKVTPLSILAFNNNRHPRSCIGITKDKKIIFLTIDGRTAESQGVSLPELTRMMQWLNCHDAINLDGGGSTTLYIENQGVVNMPCDNKKFDHEGERIVSNIVFIRKK